MESHIAEIVYAIAGRDKGDCFIVTSQEENFVYLCDGKSRKVSNPKKKKIKHIKPLGLKIQCLIFICLNIMLPKFPNESG